MNDEDIRFALRMIGIAVAVVIAWCIYAWLQL